MGLKNKTTRRAKSSGRADAKGTATNSRKVGARLDMILSDAKDRNAQAKNILTMVDSKVKSLEREAGLNGLQFSYEADIADVLVHSDAPFMFDLDGQDFDKHILYTITAAVAGKGSPLEKSLDRPDVSLYLYSIPTTGPIRIFDQSAGQWENVPKETLRIKTDLEGGAKALMESVNKTLQVPTMFMRPEDLKKILSKNLDLIRLYNCDPAAFRFETDIVESAGPQEVKCYLAPSDKLIAGSAVTEDNERLKLICMLNSWQDLTAIARSFPTDKIAEDRPRTSLERNADLDQRLFCAKDFGCVYTTKSVSAMQSVVNGVWKQDFGPMQWFAFPLSRRAVMLSTAPYLCYGVYLTGNGEELTDELTDEEKKVMTKLEEYFKYTQRI